MDALLRIAIRDNRPELIRYLLGRRMGRAGPLRHRSRAVVRGSFLGNDLSDIMAPK